jgi:hypothetical protein
LLLPLTEFAYNNVPHSATQVSPFFANKGYHPHINIKHEATSSQMAEQYAEDLGELHAYLRKQVKITIDKYA